MTEWTYRKEPEVKPLDLLYCDCAACLGVLPVFTVVLSLLGGRSIPLGVFELMMAPFVMGFFLCQGRLKTLARRHGGYWHAGGFQNPL